MLSAHPDTRGGGQLQIAGAQPIETAGLPRHALNHEPPPGTTSDATPEPGQRARATSSWPYNRGRRPSGHVIREGFTEDRGGAIPPNLLAISNTGNDRDYLDACKERDLRAHPARFPAEIPDFFVNLLTEKDDLVVDPFAGSNVTGAVAEALGRKWLSVDVDEEYVRGSMARFEHLQLQLVEPRVASDA